jgi:putative membrane protein
VPDERISETGMEVSVMGPGWEMNLGGWVWMGIWICALLVMVWFITRSPDTHGGTQEPLEILRARFARGEISQTEFEQARRVLDPEKEPRT